MTSGTDIFWELGQHLTITTVLAVIAFLVCRAARPNPATQHVLWLLVLGRLLLPSPATWPWPIPRFTGGAHNAGSVATVRSGGDSELADRDHTLSPAFVSIVDAVPGPSVDRHSDEVVGVSESADAGEVNDANTVAPDADSAPGAADRLNPASDRVLRWLVAILWGLGSLMTAAVLVWRIRRVGQLLKSAGDVDTWLENEIAGLCHRLAVRTPDCIATDAIRSPFLWCVGRVHLVWPRSMSQRDRARPILAHELAHLRRRDHWTAWVELLGLIVWWWNPVFWFVRRQLRASAEMACDAWVVELLPDQRRAYAESLVELGRRGRASQLAVGAVGAGTGSRRMFKRRLEMIMSEGFPPRFSKLVAVSAALFGVLSLPTFAIEDNTQPDRAPVPVGTSDSNDPSLAELATHVDNRLAEGQFADAAIVAQKAKSLAPDTAATVEMIAKSTAVGRLQQDSSKSDPAGANRDQSRTGEQRGIHATPDSPQESKVEDPDEDHVAGAAAALNEVLSRIEQRYYGRVDRSELERVAIEAILSKLDDRSSLLTREKYEQMTISTSGDLVGVGIAIHLDSETKRPAVTRPIRNSPGLAAGLRRGDIILQIDDKSTEGLSLNEVIDRIRGTRGSTVTLAIQRADERLVLKVVRDRFETSAIDPWAVSDDGQEIYWADHESRVGYVHIPAFTKHTASQLRKALADLSGKGMHGLVLDLRDCPGGLLTAATEVVDMFIDEGVILSSQGRAEEESVTFRATEGGEYIDLPLVLLINGSTASAGEIVAASLQDHHRAAVVGEQTFGRGTVQSIFRLQDGSALRLTTAAWLRPNGRTLLRRHGRDDWGVQPDAGLAITLTEETHKQLKEQRESRLNGERVDNPVDDAPLEKAIALLRDE